MPAETATTDERFARALAFERAWISLHQMLCAKRTGDVQGGPMRGAQSAFPFNRGYMYASD